MGSPAYASQPSLSLSLKNYGSVEDHKEFASAKFEEDVKEGLMAKISLREFRDRHGDHCAIAALAVIVEDEATDNS
eukprot:s3249_g5.t1